MTLLSSALLVASAVALPLILMLLVPAATRPLYANRMFQLASDLEDHFDRGEVRMAPFTVELLDTLYHLGHAPQHASFLVFLRPAPPVDRVTRQASEFSRVASARERQLVDDILTRMAALTARQMLRNSVAWLPLWCLWHLARATRIAMHSAGMERLRRRVNPSPTQVVSAFVEDPETRPRERVLATV